MPDQPEDSDAFKRVRSRDSQPIKGIDAGPYAFLLLVSLLIIILAVRIVS